MIHKHVPSQTRQSGCLPSLVFSFWILTLWLLSGELADDRGTSAAIFFGGLLFSFPFIYMLKKLVIQSYTDQVEHAHKLMIQDPRKPVFYLRSFDSDAHQHSKLLDSQYIGFVHPMAMLGLLIGKLVAIKPTFEQRLNMILGQIGPVIALARPGGEKVLGVSRLDEARDEDWQSVVKEFLDTSQLVVMRAGDTGGLLWEIKTIFSKDMLANLLLLIEFDGDQTPEIVKARYNKFARQVKDVTGIEFPEYHKKAHYLFFENGTTPKLMSSMGETLNAMGHETESNDFVSYAKGWLPTGWNSNFAMSMSRNWSNGIARIMGLILGLVICALVSRWGWFWLTEYDLGEGTGTFIIIFGLALTLFQAALIPKILARFKWRTSSYPAWLALFFVVWAILWSFDGMILAGEFGELFYDWTTSWMLIRGHMDMNTEYYVVSALFIWMPHLLWLLSFKVYTLSDYEASRYGIKFN